MGAISSTPAAPAITEKTVASQSGKVFLVTGATSGIGFELANILYGTGAKVWITARSSSKAEQTMASIQENHPSSKGVLKVLKVDFNDLSTIKPAAKEFQEKESRLDVLFNNAGIMIPPVGTATAQGYEAQMGVNTLAPFLFTGFLADILLRTASETGPESTRVIWVSSSAPGYFAPKGGIELEKLPGLQKSGYSQWQLYGISKTGNIFHSAEFGRKHSESGIISVALDPGNLSTNLYQNMPRWQHVFVKNVALKPPVFGAYTMLYAAFATEVANGAWVVPWGKVSEPREDIAKACKLEDNGGTGAAKRFWEWCEKEVAEYQ